MDNGDLTERQNNVQCDDILFQVHFPVTFCAANSQSENALQVRHPVTLCAAVSQSENTLQVCHISTLFFSMKYNNEILWDTGASSLVIFSMADFADGTFVPALSQRI